MRDFIGESLGRYRLLEPLGEGGMASVFKAYDTRLERYVAIKVIRPDYTRTEDFLKRFEREARALAQLTHPNIVHVNDFGEQSGVTYLVMDYIPCGTLRQFQFPMPCIDAVRLLLPIARALQYAHSMKVIHRDVKPANILITDDGMPMLSDFGLAKILEQDASTELTTTGLGIGTPGYMAPEQWRGRTSPQTDVYALGVVLFEMVTGQRPYTADTPAEILLKQANEPLPRPADLVPGISPQLEQVLFKALAKKVEDRYPDMGAMIADLEKIECALSGQPADADNAMKEKIGFALESIMPLADGGEEKIPQILPSASKKHNFHWVYVIVILVPLFLALLYFAYRGIMALDPPDRDNFGEEGAPAGQEDAGDSMLPILDSWPLLPMLRTELEQLLHSKSQPMPLPSQRLNSTWVDDQADKDMLLIEHSVMIPVEENQGAGKRHLMNVWMEEALRMEAPSPIQ